MTVPPVDDATEVVTTTIGSYGGTPDLEEEEGRVDEVVSPDLDRTSAPRCSEFICVDFDANHHPHREDPSVVTTTNASPYRPNASASKQTNAPPCCLLEMGKFRKMKKGKPDDGARGDLEETTTPALPTKTKSPSEDHGADASNSGGTSTDDDEYTEDEELNYRSIRDVSYTPTIFQMYAPPRQRQEWGQKQILPRVNWGDLFFDLFYVAAAYNASNILVEDTNAQGCLYFVATFFSLQQVWMSKMSYDARYVVSDDLYHRVQEILGLTILASIVVHIRPVSILSTPSAHKDMFALALSLTIGWTFNICRYLELYFLGQGQTKCIRGSALVEIRNSSVSLIMCIIATVLAGNEFYRGDKIGTDSHRFLAETADVYNQTADSSGYYTSSSNSSSPTNLYSTSKTTENDLPIIFLLCSPLFYTCIMVVQVVLLFPNDGSHKNFDLTDISRWFVSFAKVVPMNVDFSIHRFAEWTMLMLGESILSLLIVDVPHEDSSYFATFYFSLLTVMFLQYLHFRSMPHAADDHAMRRSKNRGVGWTIFKYLYSCALVALGAVFGVFVTSFSYEVVDETEMHRRSRRTTSMVMRIMREPDDVNVRMLASTGGSLTREKFNDMEQSAAHLFSIALSIIFFALDGMSFMTVGFEGCKSRVHCSKRLQYNIKGLLLILCRVALLVFCATLSQWETDPQVLAGAGLGITIGQIITRKLGLRYLSKNLDNDAIKDSAAKHKAEAIHGTEHAGE